MSIVERKRICLPPKKPRCERMCMFMRKEHESVRCPELYDKRNDQRRPAPIHPKCICLQQTSSPQPCLLCSEPTLPFSRTNPQEGRCSGTRSPISNSSRPHFVETPNRAFARVPYAQLMSLSATRRKVNLDNSR